MKKIISILILIAVILTLASCKSKYPAVKSTAEESRVVYTISLDGETYEIKYELYRALFLNHKASVDGGDASVWSGDERIEYVEEINEIIVKNAAKIFSAFHLARRIGIEPYSKEFDERIKENIALSVEGNGADVIGFGGDYDAYLASLTEMNLNYSVQELLLRYSLTLEAINEYYIGYDDEALGHIDGDYEFKESDVRDFYFGEDSARILHAYMQEGVTSDTKARMESLRDEIRNSSSPKDAALLMINNTAVTPTDLIVNKEVSGVVVGRYTIDSLRYGAYLDGAFSTGVGETSDILEVNDGKKGYYIIYGLEKTEEHFEAFYDDVKLAYLDNVIGYSLVEISDGLQKNLIEKDCYNDIIHADISMK